MGVCNCSMFCCTLLYVYSSIATGLSAVCDCGISRSYSLTIFAIILIGKRELVALLNLSPWCIVMVEWLFLAVPWGCLQCVIVVFPDHTNLLFLNVF